MEHQLPAGAVPGVGEFRQRVELHNLADERRLKVHHIVYGRLSAIIDA